MRILVLALMISALAQEAFGDLNGSILIRIAKERAKLKPGTIDLLELRFAAEKVGSSSSPVSICSLGIEEGQLEEKQVKLDIDLETAVLMDEDEVVRDLLERGAKVSLPEDLLFLFDISEYGEKRGLTKRPSCIKKIIKALANKLAKFRKKNKVAVGD